jgi:hypothetical protein
VCGGMPNFGAVFPFNPCSEEHGFYVQHSVFCLGIANKMLESMKKSLFFLAVWFLYRIFAAQTTKNGFA